MNFEELMELRREQASLMLDQEKVDDGLSKFIHSCWSQGKNPLIDAQVVCTEEVRQLGFIPEKGNEEDCLWVMFVARQSNTLCADPLDALNCESVKEVLDLMYTKEERRSLWRSLNMISVVLEAYDIHQAKKGK